MNIKQLIEECESLFSKQLYYLSLLQEIADHFYPQRADFTVQRNFAESYAGDLMTSYPIMIRRELQGQIGQMLRPTNIEWFKMIPKGGEQTNHEGRLWLEEMTRRMRLAMYSRPAMFNKAQAQADGDFAAFGQCVTSCRVNKNRDNLLYRTWHLRDCAWREDEEGQIGLFVRKWSPSARDLVALFGSRVSPQTERLHRRAPMEEVSCYHIVLKADFFDGFDSQGKPWVSIYYERDYKHVLEEIGVWSNEYDVARWETVSGSQYAVSPATITALPEARLLQAMTYTLLEAGEKAVNPPIIATEDTVRSDVMLGAGNLTWVDKNYDQKTGAALEPLKMDLRGLPFGQDMIDDSRAMLMQAFFLNKLTLPERAAEMTAYEVGERIKEYIRQALPIFEPMEPERNGQTCETTFNTLLRAGVFGSPRDIPAQLLHDGIDFEYQSPLHDAIEEQKGQLFLESKALIAEALDLDQGAPFVMDTREALRDALTAVGVPTQWLNTPDEVDEMVDAEAERQNEQARLEAAVQSSQAAKNLGDAGQNLEIV